jgi:hypothetical protein
MTIATSGGYDTITVPVSAFTPGTLSVSGYALYAGSSSGAESGTPVATIYGTGSFTPQTTASPGTSRFYVVKAFDSAGNFSGASNEVSSTTNLVLAEFDTAFPISIVTAGGFDTITVPASAFAPGSYAIAGYDLYAGSYSGGESSTAVATRTGTGSFTPQTTAAQGSSKYYVVKAFDSQANLSADSSNEVHSTTAAASSTTMTINSLKDVSGWPTTLACIRRLELVLPDPATASLLSDIAPILAGVIAEFESPTDRFGGGGTGRQFTPAPDVRLYDGNGLSELRIDDMVPNTPLTISVFNQPVDDAALVVKHHALGYHTITRLNSNGDFFPYFVTPAYFYNVFPLGTQNISVSGTFGFAAQVPNDIYEAVRSEVCYRALIQGAVDLAGIGEKVVLSEFQVDTAAGVSVWSQSSPLALFHNQYLGALRRYRDKDTWRRANLRTAMS